MIKSIQAVLLFLFCSSISAVEIGDSIPSCNRLDLSEYKNKVLLIDFWATWCPPCKQSMPFLNALRNELADKGFEIIAINVDEETEVAQNFLNNYPVDYPVVFDPKGECPLAYDVKAMPSSYFVDKKGKIRYVHFGFRHQDESEIRARVLELLKRVL